MFVTPYTYDPKSKICFEKPNLHESETVPNQTFTIQEIITRFTGGIMPNVNRKIEFDQEDLRNENFDAIDPTRRPDYDLVDAIYDIEDLTERFLERKREAETEVNKSPETIPDNKEPKPNA